MPLWLVCLCCGFEMRKYFAVNTTSLWWQDLHQPFSEGLCWPRAAVLLDRLRILSPLNGVKNFQWPLRIHWSQTINVHFYVSILPVLEKFHDWETFGLCCTIGDVTWRVVHEVQCVARWSVCAGDQSLSLVFENHPPHRSSSNHVLSPLL